MRFIWFGKHARAMQKVMSGVWQTECDFEELNIHQLTAAPILHLKLFSHRYPRAMPMSALAVFVVSLLATQLTPANLNSFDCLLVLSGQIAIIFALSLYVWPTPSAWTAKARFSCAAKLLKKECGTSAGPLTLLDGQIKTYYQTLICLGMFLLVPFGPTLLEIFVSGNFSSTEIVVLLLSAFTVLLSYVVIVCPLLWTVRIRAEVLFSEAEEDL